MITDINKLILNFKKNLTSKKLPGINAQLKMSPSIRNPYFESQRPNKSTKNAAVLITLIIQRNLIKTVLIKRTEYKGTHSGQISFPGGKAEKNDKNIFQTALREAKEEIGINPNNIEILGALTPLYIPVSNICVYPIIGLSYNSIEYIINKTEVVEAIETSLDNLLDSKNISEMTFITNNFEITAPYYNVQNNKVWGATAMIISEFLEAIKASDTNP